MAVLSGISNIDERYRFLSAAGDLLTRLASMINFDVFRPWLQAALRRSDRSRSGRPACDPMFMSRVLVQQRLYYLSGEQAGRHFHDPLPFLRFCGLKLSNWAPTAMPGWLARKLLAREVLFTRFRAILCGQGYLAMGGQVVEATAIEAVRQRNGEGGKTAPRAGRGLEDWNAKLVQKDCEARWRIERGRKAEPKADDTSAVARVLRLFGFKTLVSVDCWHRLIRRQSMASAVAHEGRPKRELFNKSNLASKLWANTGCRVKRSKYFTEKHGFISMVHVPKPRGRSVLAHHRKANLARSKVRSALEHVFAAGKYRVAVVGVAKANRIYDFTKLAGSVRELPRHECPGPSSVLLQRPGHHRCARTLAPSCRLKTQCFESSNYLSDL